MLKRKKLYRESNIEVLRILAMFMILLGHAWYHYECGVGDYPLKKVAYHIVNPLLYMHVDIFVLISGYFGLKLKSTKIFSLYTTCLFYTFVAMFFAFVLPDISFHWKSLLFPITQGGWWFIRIYVALILISPMLNLIIEYYHSRHQWRGLIVIAFIFNFYISYLHRVDSIYSMGYDLFNFSCLYILGRYVALKKVNWCSKTIVTALLVLSFFKLGISELGFTFPIIEKAIRIKTYCNPVNVFSAFLVFLLFLKWKKGWSNPLVNNISTSTLSIYLVTDNQYVRGGGVK